MKKNSNLKLQKSKAHSYRFTAGRFLQVAVALVFLVFTARFLYIGISKTVNGENLIELNEKIFMSIKENGINYIDFIVQIVPRK